MHEWEYYCVTAELKCHNICSKYPPFSLTQVWIRMSHPRHSDAVTLSCISGDRTYEWKVVCLFIVLNFTKLYTIRPHLRTSNWQQLPAKRISWLIACCKHAPTLARQMWRSNYIIDRIECLISTFSESTVLYVYSLQFLFKSTHHSWRYVEETVSGCFFLNTVYITHIANGQHAKFSAVSHFTWMGKFTTDNLMQNIGTRMLWTNFMELSYLYIS